MITSVMWVGHMPVAPHNHAAGVSIVSMVADRSHFLGCACLVDVVALHDTLHWHTMQCKPSVLVICLETFCASNAESVAILIPVSSCPSMAMPSVHHRTSVVAPSIEVSTLHFLD